MCVKQWTLEGESKYAIVGSNTTKKLTLLNSFVYSKTVKSKETIINWVFGYYEGHTESHEQSHIIDNSATSNDYRLVGGTKYFHIFE